MIEWNYNSILLSDHCPTSLVYRAQGVVKGSSRWRFHHRWLSDLNFLQKEARIELFFYCTDEISAIVKREAFKAYIKGMIIYYTSSKTNKLKLKMNELDHKIRQLEREIFLDGSTKAKQELQLLKAQYEELSTSKAGNSLIWLQQLL